MIVGIPTKKIGGVQIRIRSALMEELDKEINNERRMAVYENRCYLCDDQGGWEDKGKWVTCPDCEVRKENGQKEEDRNRTENIN